MDEDIEDVFIDPEKMPKGSAAVIWYTDGAMTCILPRTEDDEDPLIPESPECWASMVMTLATEFTEDMFLSQYRDSIVDKMYRFMEKVIEREADTGITSKKSSMEIFSTQTSTKFRGLQIVRDNEEGDE